MNISTVKGSDEKARFVLKKLHETEKSMASVKDALDKFLEYHERLRGKRLKLALALKGFSETETPNVKQALLNTAEAFVDLEEYRKYMHDRIGSKATEPIKLYKIICKNLREEVKSRENAISKEQKKQMELDKLTIKDSGNRSKITQSQMNLANAATGLEHVSIALAENMERFQSKKIQDVKTILFEMIYSEMQYHSKALEVLSNVQSSIFAMDMDTDIAEVREKLASPASATKEFTY